MDYEYYIVVVPHIYKKKESDHKPKLGYKYSLNYNMRVRVTKNDRSLIKWKLLSSNLSMPSAPSPWSTRSKGTPLWNS